MKNELLRHLISTIQYRFEKSVKESNQNFGEFNIGNASRSPEEIINHMYDVIYSTRIFIEEESLPEVKIQKLSFEEEVKRFTLELKKVDQLLNTKQFDINYSKKLLQGPFSDVLTHIGQISMLQRLDGKPLDGEDFSRSQIKTGITD